MITVYKANRIVQVSENELNKYLSKGYVVKEEPVPQAVQEVVIQPSVEENKVVLQSEVQSEQAQFKRTRKRK